MNKFFCGKCSSCQFNPAFKDEVSKREAEKCKADGRWPACESSMTDEKLIAYFRSQLANWDCEACSDPDFFTKAAPHDIAEHYHNVTASKKTDMTHTFHQFRKFSKLTADKGIGKALKWWYDHPAAKCSDFTKAVKSSSMIEALNQSTCIKKNDDNTYSITELGTALLKEFSII